MMKALSRLYMVWDLQIICLVGNINAWRVNGDNPAMRLPEFTQSPLYPDASTPSTVMSVISDWSSMPPFYPIYASTELVGNSDQIKNIRLILIEGIENFANMCLLFYSKHVGVVGFLFVQCGISGIRWGSDKM